MKQTLQDIIGGDLDSSQLKASQVTVMFNDQLNISTGGLTTNSAAATIYIRPQISNCILDLNSIGIAFRLEMPYAYERPINFVSLFMPVSVKFGNWSQSYNPANGTLTQQCLEQMNADEIIAYKRCLGIGDFDDGNFNCIVGAGVGTSNDVSQPYTISNTSTLGAQALNGGINCFNEYLAQGTRGSRVGFVPLKFIFPNLIQSWGNLIYVKYGQQIEFQMQTNASVCCTANILAAGNTLFSAAAQQAGSKQFSLFDQYVSYSYASLNNCPEIVEAIMSSELEFHPKFYVYQGANATTTAGSEVLTFGYDSKMKIHGFQFAYHANSSSRTNLAQLFGISGTSTTVAAQQQIFYNGNDYSGECLLFPSMAIQQVQLQLPGGQLFNINESALEALQLLSTVGSLSQGSYEEGGYMNSQLWKALRTVYDINLQRIGIEDLVGSSGLSGSIIITIYRKAVDQSWIAQCNPYTVATGQGTIETVLAPTNGTLALVLYGFMCYSQTVIMKNGEYYSA